ncbi:putative neural-cadherin 2 [Diaphorina citri]|uniref:Neural-cadherin 2 n=1 Tax=Diaphorina citri TaxID=121845 RepID=A0A1S3D6I5_DIACI|nr:putative neural-cadherin 2 [Diaphorina citri]
MPPVFNTSLYPAIMEEELPGPYPHSLLKVLATDGDKDRQNNIVYFLTGQGIDADNPGNSKFDINRTTGEIFFAPLIYPSRIRYEITSGNIGGAFAVKNMTGAIYVAGALDYETRKRSPSHIDSSCHVLYGKRTAYSDPYF